MITTIYLETTDGKMDGMLVRCDLDDPDDVIEFCWPGDDASSRIVHRWLPSGYTSADARGQDVGLVRIGQRVYQRESDWNPAEPEDLETPNYDWNVIEVVTNDRTNLIVSSPVSVTDMEGYDEFGDYGPIYPVDPDAEDDEDDEDDSE